MNEKPPTMDANRAGLSLGTLFAILHATWAFIIAISNSSAQSFVNWFHTLHMVAILTAVQPFSLINALELVLFAFISGYAIGWLYAKIWNYFSKSL